jgi:hypothetical protein
MHREPVIRGALWASAVLNGAGLTALPDLVLASIFAWWLAGKGSARRAVLGASGL